MKINRIIPVFMCFLMLLSTQCNDDDMPSALCENEVLIDDVAYDTAESGNYSLVSTYIEGDCLFIKISASGCDGSTWDLQLIDSEQIAESSPPQRSLKFILINNEACLAVFTQEKSFDLTALRIEDTNEVVLNIEDFPEALVYSY